MTSSSPTPSHLHVVKHLSSLYRLSSSLQHQLSVVVLLFLSYGHDFRVPSSHFNKDLPSLCRRSFFAATSAGDRDLYVLTLWSYGFLITLSLRH